MKHLLYWKYNHTHACSDDGLKDLWPFLPLWGAEIQMGWWDLTDRCGTCGLVTCK